MSATMDPAKLKVVELRAELASRGLDTKGNKPVLVKRLREAIEAESGYELPDTSIADTSTEDLSTSNVSLSQLSPPESELETKEPDQEATSESVSAPPTESTPKSKTKELDDSLEKPKELKSSEKMEETKPDEKSIESTPVESIEKSTEVSKTEIDDKTPEKEQDKVQSQISEDKNPNTKEPEKMEATSESGGDEDKTMEVEEEQEKQEVAQSEVEPELDDVEMREDDSKIADDSNQDSTEGEKDSSEPRNRKSRWGAVSDTEPTDSGGMDDSTGDATGSGELRGEKRRHGSPSPERVARKRSRSPIQEDEPDYHDDTIQLSWIDSDLNLQVNKENLTIAEPIHNEGFGYMWAGVRSTHGVNKGKVWYEVKLLDNCDWEEDKKDTKKDKNKDKKDQKEPEKVEDGNKDEVVVEEPVHVFRVGWSLPSTDLQLGEQPHSYAYDSEGYIVTDSEFTEYGIQYSVGDVISTFLDMESNSNSITLTYAVNGALLPTAFTIERSQLPEDSAFFPHLLTRNVKFEVNFGQKEEPWYKPPTEFENFTFIKDSGNVVAGLKRPVERKECEVLMMIGLPCSGKTYWVNNHVTNNPEKKYNVLGIGCVLDKMKYQGKSRKEHFKGSTTVLMDKCTRCLTKLIDIASTKRRNYIIDQTNLFSSAQRRKMRPFDGFRRQAVVIVVADDEQSSREKSRQQADGKDVPDSAVLEMKANMCLPTVCDWLDEVTYAELDETKAKEIVQKYNKQGREAGYGPNYTAKQHNNLKKNMNDRRNQWGRNNKRDNSRDNRNNRWGGGGHNRQSNWSGNRGSGGWGRHDNRNHHHGGGGGRGSDYRNNSNNRMVGGGGYNRNQGGSGGGGGYNRNRNQAPHRNQMQNKGGNWGGQGGGGGNWNNQGSWGSQGGWGGHQSGQGGSSGSGWNQGSWSQYGNNQGGGQGGNQQWKGGYNAQQYQQQGYAQGYTAGQYGQGQYANWNYYGQYAQGWNPQAGQQGNSGNNNDNSGNSAQYNHYTQQQQAAWAQYAQSGYGGYGQTASQGSGSNTLTGSSTTQQSSATKQ